MPRYGGSVAHDAQPLRGVLIAVTHGAEADEITQVAVQRNVKRFYAKVMPENKAMLAIFQNSGYRVNTEFDGEVYNISYDLKNKEE